MLLPSDKYKQVLYITKFRCRGFVIRDHVFQPYKNLKLCRIEYTQYRRFTIRYKTTSSTIPAEFLVPSPFLPIYHPLSRGNSRENE